MIALERAGFAVSGRTSGYFGQRFLETLAEWTERRRQRRALLSLSPELLKDVGLSQGDAWCEGCKPFWRA